MNRHIIIVNDYCFINGGASKIAIYTAIGLADQDKDVYFFGAVGPICEELKKSKCKVICLNQQDINHKDSKFKVLTEGVDNKTARKEFKKLIDSFGDDEVIVHLHAWNKAISSSPFRYLKSKANAKSVVTLHDYFTICPNGGLYDYKHKHICHLKSDMKCLFCNCDKRSYLQKLFRFYRYKRQQRDMKEINDFIYISQLNKKVFLEKYKGKPNMFFVQNFVESAKEKVPHPELNEYYLYVGRISEEKGVDTLCQALTQTNNKGFIIGDGPMYDELKEKYPNLVFTGWLNHDQMVPYIMKSKAFVFPSKWYEGAPLIIPEMLSYGLPCIVSDCSAAVEIINEKALIFSNYDELCVILLKREFMSPKDAKFYDLHQYEIECLKTYSYLT